MYTVYDFINSNIESKHMKFGWKVDIIPSSLLCQSKIALTYTMLNFDYRSLEYLNDEVYNMFLSSISYQNMKSKKDRAMAKYKRLYFSAFSIEELKNIVSGGKIKVDIDRLIEKAIARRSENIKEKISEKKSLQEN